MQAYFAAILNRAVPLAVAPTLDSLNTKFMRNYTVAVKRANDIDARYQELRNKRKKLDLIEARYCVNVMERPNSDDSGDESGGGDGGYGEDNSLDPDPQPSGMKSSTSPRPATHVDNMTWNELIYVMLDRLRKTRDGRYGEYQTMLTAARHPSVALDHPIGDAASSRHDEENVRQAIFQLLYNPSYKYCLELAMALNDQYERSFIINRRKQMAHRQRKRSAKSKLGNFEAAEQPTKEIVQVTPSTWFRELESVFEASFRQLEAGEEGTAMLLGGSYDTDFSTAPTNRRTDLPSPCLFENIFYLKERGKLLVNPATGETPTTPEEIAVARIDTKVSEVRTYTLDINNLLVVFATELFGYTNFVPEAQDRIYMKPDKFTDLQLFVEYALLLFDPHKLSLFDYLRQPASYLVDPGKKQKLIKAVNQATKQLLQLSQGYVFKTNQRGKIQLCKIVTESGASNGNAPTAKIEPMPVPDQFCKVLMSLQIPNTVHFRQKLKRTSVNPLYTGVPSNFMSGSQEVLEIMSKLSQLINFNTTAIAELATIYKSLMQEDVTNKVDNINMKMYQHDGLMQTRQDIFFTLVTTAVVIKACKPKNISAEVDCTDFVNHCMWPLSDKKDTLALHLPDDENPVLFSSVFSRATGLLFYMMLASNEHMIDTDVDLGMLDGSYFRDTARRADQPYVRRGETTIPTATDPRLITLGATSSIEGLRTGGVRSRAAASAMAASVLGYGTAADTRPVQQDRLMFFNLFKTYTDKIPRINRVSVEKRSARVLAGTSIDSMSNRDPLTGIVGPRKIDIKESILPMITNMRTVITMVKSGFTNRLLTQSHHGYDYKHNVMNYFKDHPPYHSPLNSTPIVTENFNMPVEYTSKIRGTVEFFNMPVTYRHSKVHIVPEESEIIEGDGRSGAAKLAEAIKGALIGAGLGGVRSSSTVDGMDTSDAVHGISGLS